MSMKVKLITTRDSLRAEQLLDIKGGISEELKNQLEGCDKCNCCFGNENKTKRKEPETGKTKKH